MPTSRNFSTRAVASCSSSKSVSPIPPSRLVPAPFRRVPAPFTWRIWRVQLHADLTMCLPASRTRSVGRVQFHSRPRGGSPRTRSARSTRSSKRPMTNRGLPCVRSRPGSPVRRSSNPTASRTGNDEATQTPSQTVGRRTNVACRRQSRTTPRPHCQPGRRAPESVDERIPSLRAGTPPEGQHRGCAVRSSALIRRTYLTLPRSRIPPRRSASPFVRDPARLTWRTRRGSR